MNTRIWIDTADGTWGSVDDLVIVDLGKVADNDGDRLTDAYSYVAFLNSESDSVIADFGRKYGDPVR